MDMTKKARAIANMVKQLQILARRADDLELTLGNGAQVGALISSMADELSLVLQDRAFDL